ncbi:uncharacterized protein BJ212DRAFT_1298674 [Suillus subaureus]|uniref:Uncharacterized protein n=1 Tax=Suillus subaureus TaxID=48587 RepID=A0A9P7EE23_9AGAM|nr:uncharacterized protein BJ212DRAFT_1298674 [Suillus subaureus]KAG1818601.1 hypothetical protein BJ212DRAFT_1298674 [Suillus subaureus]
MSKPEQPPIHHSYLPWLNAPFLTQIKSHFPILKLINKCFILTIQILLPSDSPSQTPCKATKVPERELRKKEKMHLVAEEEMVAKPLACAEIVQLILDHGKLQLPDIISQLDKCIKYEAEEKVKIVGFPTVKELQEAQETGGTAEMGGGSSRERRLVSKHRIIEVEAKRSDQSSVIQEKATEEDMVDDNVYFQLIKMAVGEHFNQCAALIMRATLKVLSHQPKKPLVLHLSRIILV